jgi:endonuclease G
MRQASNLSLLRQTFLYKNRIPESGKNYVKYQVIGSNNVSVPTHFFKVMVGELEDHQLELEAYVLPNEKIPDHCSIASFQVRYIS